jgi:hypothetical protein
MRLVHPDEQSQFRSGKLPPGEYWIAAVDALEESAMQDPEVLKRLASVGRRVDVRSASTLTLDIPLARLSQ